MKKIILINGKKRSGKDFTASLIQQELYKQRKTSMILSFADPIKSMVATLFNISNTDLDKFKNEPDDYGYAIQAYPNNQPQCNIQYGDFRTILQRFGTESLKPWFGEDVWARLLVERAKKEHVDYVIVPDFRFLCEDISDITINVKNDENISEDEHRSETELQDANFKFKYTIDNTGKPDITKEIEQIVEDILRV